MVAILRWRLQILNHSFTTQSFEARNVSWARYCNSTACTGGLEINAVGEGFSSMVKSSSREKMTDNCGSVVKRLPGSSGLKSGRAVIVLV